MMNAFEVLIQQADEKIDQLKDYLAEGKAESFEDYKKLCGEIRGLLIMRGYTLDLKQRLETSDD
jgi:hypothetical protein